MSEALVTSYEIKIENLEKEKLKISNNLQKELKDVRTPLKRKMKLVRNALDIWKSSNLENKKTLIKNVFPE